MKGGLAAVLRVGISELRENVYLAKLVIGRDGLTKEIDARPSDAVALALRLNAPIFVSEELLQSADEGGSRVLR